jgi:hypothetical protein
VFKREKTIHALDRAATVIGQRCYYHLQEIDNEVLGMNTNDVPF